MIKQRSWGDCGIATLINAVSDNRFTYFNGPGGYERLVELFEGRNSGITIQEVSATLFFCGFTPLYLPLSGFRTESGISNAHVIHTEIMDYAMKGEKAVLQVKTKSGLLHLVYFDGRNIWDPSPNSGEHPVLSDYESIVDAVFFKRAKKRCWLKDYTRSAIPKVTTLGRKIAFELRVFAGNPTARKIAEYEKSRKSRSGDL